MERTVKSAFLVILMIIMTQVGYLDLINSSRTGNDSFEDDSSVMETGGSGSAIVYAMTTRLSTGERHTCAILDNGDVKCWGCDQYGQVGDGGPTWTGTNPTNTDTLKHAIDLGTGRTAVALSSGTQHTCAILDNGDLKCWGRDAGGQLGDGGGRYGPYPTQPTSTPLQPLRLTSARAARPFAMGTGAAHTCAILDNTDLKCWGRDIKDSWAMVEASRTATRLQPLRLTSAQVERLLRWAVEGFHLRPPR